MDPSWMELVLDSLKNFQLQTKQLFEQQKALHLQALSGIVSTEPPLKRRKASKQFHGADGKENIFPVGIAQNKHGNTSRIFSSKIQEKKLMDESSSERSLNPTQATYFEETDEGKLRDDVKNTQQDSLDNRHLGDAGHSAGAKLSNVAILPRTCSLEKTQLVLSPLKPNPVRGRKRAVAVKGETLSVTGSPNVLLGAERLEKVNDNSELPCLPAAPMPVRMTRARAKTLKNGEAHSVSAQCGEPAKKVRAQKGKAKALPQSASGREVDESANTVAGVLVPQKISTGNEVALDGNEKPSGEADELRKESIVDQIDNINTAALPQREQSVKKRRGRPKAGCKTTSAVSEEKLIPGVVNLQFREKRQLGFEAIQLYAEEQSGGEDVPAEERIKIPDDSTMGVAQRDKMSSPLQLIGETATQTITSVCKEGNIVHGDAYTPLVVVRDLRIKPGKEDGERKSREADVVSGDGMEDVVLGAGGTLIAHAGAKRGISRAGPMGTISSCVKINEDQRIADSLSVGGKDSKLDTLYGDGDRQHGVADGVVEEHINFVVGVNRAAVPVGQGKQVAKSAQSFEDEEVVTDSLSIEVQDVGVVSSQVEGRTDCGKRQDARNDGLLEAEMEVCNASSQESQPVFETNTEVKRLRKGRRQKGSLNFVSNRSSSERGDINVSLEDVQPKVEKSAKLHSEDVQDDRYNEGNKDAIIEKKRDDEDDFSSADLDSERWEDIKKSVKVRKGRGKAVSSFLGYADSDLFPPRSFALGSDNVFDLALEQGTKHIENERASEEGIKCIPETAGRFSDLLQKMEAAAFDSVEKNLRRELDLGEGRRGDVEEGRNSGASRGWKLVARQFTVSEEFCGEAVKGRIGTDANQPSMASVKKRVMGTPVIGMGLEQEWADIGGGRSVVTPKAKIQGSGPVSESLERSAGAVVSGRGLRHLMNELKLELESTEPRNFTGEIVIDLCPEDRSGTAEKIVQENPLPVAGYNRGLSHDCGQGDQVEASTFKRQSAEWTVDLARDPKLVSKGDIKVRSYDKQGSEVFANVQEENVQVEPIPLQALESSVVSEIEKLRFVSLEQVRPGSGYQGDDASPVHDAGLRGTKLRIRPFSEFNAAKASMHRKIRSVFTSLEGGEFLKLDEEQPINPLESGGHSTSVSSKARRVPTARNTVPVHTTPTRGNVSPFEGEPSNKRPPSHMSSKLSAQRANRGEFSLFKEAFALRSPLRSQRPNVTEVSANCQRMGQEASPPFHVANTRRSCRTGSLNNQLSQSQTRGTSSRVGEYEGGGSGVQACATARSPPEELSTRVDLSGGGLRYESTRVSPTVEMNDTSVTAHLHYEFSSPARVHFRDESVSRRSVGEDQYKSGRYGKFTMDSLQKSGKLRSQTRAITVTPRSLLGHSSRPLNVVVDAAGSPPQQLSNENWSGDTMVLSDEDDPDTLTSTRKSLDTSRQDDKLEVPACSPSCEPEKLSLSMTVTFDDLNPRELSLRCGVRRAESDLAVKEIGNSSNSIVSQQLKYESGPSGAEVKGDRIALPGRNSERKTFGSGGYKERLERSKRTINSPLSGEPKRSRFSPAEGSPKGCGRTPEDSELDRKTSSSNGANEVTAAESLQQAGADVHSSSTAYESGEEEGFRGESSGNTGTESRRMSKFRSLQGVREEDHVLEVRELSHSAAYSGDNEFADEESSWKEGAHVTDVEECSGDHDTGTEELVGPTKSLKQRIKSGSRKSSRKRKEQEFPEGNCYFHQQDQHGNGAEAQSLSPCSSYGAHSVHFENSSARRTKAKRTVDLQETASCHEIADSETPISSYGKACVEETPIAKAGGSNERARTNSNVVNPCAQSTRLLSNVRTLIPVSQRPAPNFIPNGKRDVKVKALEAAEAARRLQEKREIEKRERMQKRAEAIARRAMEKEKPKEEMQKAEQESKVSQKAISDSTTAKDVSFPTTKAVLTDCTNSKSSQSPRSKSTRALALKIKLEQEKTKKLEEELKRKDEERKKKEAEILARKRKKEEAEKKDREEKRRRQEELLKQRREQEERLRAELEEKEHRHRLLEEAERERKALEEEARRQRRAERERERERRQKDELEAKAARQAEKDAERKRKEEVFLIYKASEEHDYRFAEIMGAASTAPRLRSQHSTGLSTDKLRASNLLPTGPSVSFGKAARVPSTALEGRTHVIATPVVKNKGPTSSLSTMKSQSLGSGPTTAGLNAEMDGGPKTFATPILPALEHGDIGPQSYEISPYRSSSDDEDEDKDRPQRPKKFVPAWASKENLMPQLLRQLTQDPDEIFAGTKTCSLKEVFGTSGSKKVLDFGRRSGSGDWVKDRVSWKEELQYKIDMGYMSHIR